MDPDPAAQALAVLELARRGRFDEIHERFAPQLRPLALPESVRAAWADEVDRLGPVTLVGTPVTEPAGPAPCWSGSR